MPEIPTPADDINSNSNAYGVYAGFTADDEKWKNAIGKKNFDNTSGPNYTKDFNATTNKTSWFSFDLCEKYNQDSPLKQFHMLTIYLKNSVKNTGCVIKATLPEQFTYNIGGEWGNPIQLSGGDTLNAFLSQVTGGKVSTQQSVDSFMVWQKPKRLELNLKIKVFDDTSNDSRINYQEAFDLLSRAVLPDTDTNGYYEKIPGPIMTRVLNSKKTDEKKIKLSESMQYMNDKIADNMEIINGKSSEFDRITVQIGGVLLVDWCVIRNIKITYPNTKAQILHNYKGTEKEKKFGYKMHLQPLIAELEITISTVMSLTQLAFRSMLYLNDQKSPQKTAEEHTTQSMQSGDSLRLTSDGINPELEKAIDNLDYLNINLVTYDSNGRVVLPEP